MSTLRVSALLLVAGAAMATLSGQQAPVTITHGPMLGRPALDGGRRVGADLSSRERFGCATAWRRCSSTTWSDNVTTVIEHDNTGLGSDQRAQAWHGSTSTRSWRTRPGQFDRTGRSHASSRRDVPQPGTQPQRPLQLPLRFRNLQQPASHRFRVVAAAYKAMLGQLRGTVDFGIMNGDSSTKGRNNATTRWTHGLDQVGLKNGQAPRIVQLAPAIVGVWENYKVYMARGDALMAWQPERADAVHLRRPREIIDNIDGTSAVGRRNRKAVFRDTGVQAWYDYIGWANPIQAGVDSLRTGDLKAGSEHPQRSGRRLQPAAPSTRRARRAAPSLGGRTGCRVREADVSQAAGAASGDPKAGVYEILAKLDAHRLRIRPAGRRKTARPPTPLDARRTSINASATRISSSSTHAAIARSATRPTRIART